MRASITAFPTKDCRKLHQQEIEETWYVVRMWLLTNLCLRASINNNKRLSLFTGIPTRVNPQRPIGTSSVPAKSSGSTASGL